MATGGSYESRARGVQRSRREVWFPPRHVHSSETKPFFLTSEFLAYVAYMVGLGVAASTDATIDSRLFWLLTTAATAGYMLSRGIAKSGSRSSVHDPCEDIDLGGRD